MGERRDLAYLLDISSGSEGERSSTSTAPTGKDSVDQDDTGSDDIEAQLSSKGENLVALEYSIPTSTKYLYLALYFALNLVLTLYNKVVLGKFPFPWLLTTLHTSCACLGCYVLMIRGYFKTTRLTSRENLILMMFSWLFTLNIAISNVSLEMVSVPFHQIMRSTCPIFTILLYKLFFSRTYSNQTYFSLVPVVFGVGLVTYGDYHFSTMGFLLTLLGVLLSSIKTVASNRLMTGSLALPALEILLRTGELSAFHTWVIEGHLTPTYGLALIGNGLLAFVLNVSSFYTNKLAGALTVTVCANLKQCLTVLLGIALFNVEVGRWNGVGMLITLAGAAMYSKVELASKGSASVDKAGEATRQEKANKAEQLKS